MEPAPEAAPAAAAVRNGSPPPAWALAIVLGAIACVVLAALLLQAGYGSWRAYVPFGESDFFYVFLIALPVAVLLAVAVLVKMLEVRRASAWPTAAGRIVTSQTGAPHPRRAGDATAVGTAPVVEYEFSVGGDTWRGKRIGIGEDSGGADTEATLRRYPVGAIVSVHYDPADPRNCVLERDVPEGVGKGLALLAGFGVAAAAALYWLTTDAPRLIERLLPGAAGKVPVVIVAACAGVLVLLVFIASHRSSRAAPERPAALHWLLPVVALGCFAVAGYAAGIIP